MLMHFNHITEFRHQKVIEQCERVTFRLWQQSLMTAVLHNTTVKPPHRRPHNYPPALPPPTASNLPGPSALP